MSKAVNTKLTPKVSSNCMMLTISICFQVRLCPPATAFGTKRNRWHRVSSMGKPQRGKIDVTSRKKMHRRSCYAPHTSPLGAACMNSRTTWARSTEQRYKKKSNYKRRTPDCVFLCRESAATAPPYNEMGSSSQFVCKVTKHRNNYKTNRKNFLSRLNSFERYDNTSRRFAPKTRLLSRKNRDILNKTPLLYSPTPHPTSLPTHPHPLLPLYARLRALSEFSFFTFTLHHPRYLPHSW